MLRLLPVSALLLLIATAAQAQQADTLRTDSLRFQSATTSDPGEIRVSGSRSIAVFSTIQPLLNRAAGVQYTPYSGAPGAGAIVRIRGAASLDSHAQPLYVVDGVPMFQYQFGSPAAQASFPAATINPDASTNPLLSIVPEDVEKVEILKGAFDTGQYGFLGQNGVIRITTRRGAAGQSLRVQYIASGGVQMVRHRYSLLGAREAAELANEAARNNGYAPDYSPAEIAGFGAGTDWQAKVLRAAAVQEHHLALSGGTAHGTRYYAGLDYRNQQGIVLSSDLHRYGLRLNLDQTVGRHLRLRAGLSYNEVSEHRPTVNLLPLALRWLPTVPVFEANGDYATDYGNANPVQMARQNLSVTRNRRLLAHAELRYEFITGLSLHLRASVERDSLNARDYQGPADNHQPRDGFETGVRSGFYQQWVLNPALRYARTFAGRHALTASAEATSWNNRQAQTFAQFSVPTPPFNLPPRANAGGRFSRSYSFLSYQLLGSYTYAGRYMLQGSLRADNSSLMPAAQRQQWLPAAQATWHAAQESWLPGRATISTLDVWAGWGQTSNRGNFAGDHGFTYQFTNTSLFQFLDELTTQADAGLRLGLWQGRLDFTAAVYQRTTRADRGFPGSSSPPDPADITNRGLELTLAGHWQHGRLSGSTSVAVAFNRNRYDKPAGSLALDLRPSPYYFTVTPGQPLSSFLGYRYLGVDAAGQPRFEGQVGNPYGTQQVLGSGLPGQVLSLTQALHYGRFDFAAQVDGLFGYQVFDPNLSLLDLPYGGFNATTRVRDRWTPANLNTDVPRAGTTTAGAAQFRAPNTYLLQSGNHLRLSSVVLSAEVWRKAPRAISVFLSGTNLLVLTAYRGFDPNVSAAEDDPRQAGLDLATYPVPRTVSLGVRATL